VKVCLKDSFTLATAIVLGCNVSISSNSSLIHHTLLIAVVLLTSMAFASNESLALGEPYDFPMRHNDLFFSNSLARWGLPRVVSRDLRNEPKPRASLAQTS
jgi:hypothetical protein